MGTNWSNTGTENCAWNNQDDAFRTTDDQFQDDLQRWLCCFCMEPPPSIYKSSCPWIVIGRSAGQGERESLLGQQSTPLSQLSASNLKSKLSFPPTCLFFGFWVVSSWTPIFGNKVISQCGFDLHFSNFNEDEHLFIHWATVFVCLFVFLKSCLFHLHINELLTRKNLSMFLLFHYLFSIYLMPLMFSISYSASFFCV